MAKLPEGKESKLEFDPDRPMLAQLEEWALEGNEEASDLLKALESKPERYALLSGLRFGDTKRAIVESASLIPKVDSQFDLDKYKPKGDVPRKKTGEKWLMMIF